MLRFSLVAAAAIALVFTATAPAMAKKAKRGGKVTGIYCAQGGQNIFVPASRFTARQRASLRVGQRARINIAGYGPISCVVH